MKKYAVPAFLILFLATAPLVCSAASSFVGVVKAVKGEAFVIRDDHPSKAEPGMDIQVGDTLKTGTDGGMGVIFGDDTVISMGPDTEIVLKTYLFEPLEGKMSFLARMVKGTVSFLCGQIAKLAPDSVRIEIPAATIGPRGTHFLVKVED